jgi:AcrR family transcriptional regulator
MRMANSRQRIIDAALTTLKEKGFAGTSTRAIAATGGFKSGLIFYYFPSRDDLLIAALEHASAERLERYGEEVAAASTLTELLALLERIYADDRESGFVRVVSEMVAGSVANPELGPRMVELVEPWIAAAQTAAGRLGAEAGLLAQPGHGVIQMAVWGSQVPRRVGGELVEPLRAAIEAEGGSLVVERAPADIKTVCDAWGTISPETLTIMKRIKTEFDPQECLSPGRFVGGL